MTEIIYKATAYEKETGTQHTFQVFAHDVPGKTPYMILLDGAFLTAVKSGPAIAKEIKDTISWFDWNCINPLLA